MKCPVCGHESDGKFCENCGSPLTQNNTQENATNSVDSFDQNGTSYGQQFTNTQNSYGGQQFTNVPNGGNNKGKKDCCYYNKRRCRYYLTFDCHYLCCGMQHYSEPCQNCR